MYSGLFCRFIYVICILYDFFSTTFLKIKVKKIFFKKKIKKFENKKNFYNLKGRTAVLKTSIINPKTQKNNPNRVVLDRTELL